MSTVAVPADDRPLALTRSRTNVVFVTILLGMLLAALDQTIVSTALPTIVADLGGAGHMAWVVTAYILAEAVSTVLAGKFGDLFGRRLVFQVSAIIFVGASAVAGLSGSMAMLIGARAVQGIGAGGLMVTAMALIADVIPLRERGKYQGALGAVFGVTTVLGPLLGGLFTDHLSWRWCFYVNIPVAVVVLIMVRTIPDIRAAARPIIDYAGIALVALGACSLVLGLEWGGTEYAWGSTTIIGLFALAAAFLTGFVLVELRAAEPMLPMGLFRNQVFTVCSILSFVVGFGMFGALTYLPTYLQYVEGASATTSGLRILPMVVGLLLTATLSGDVVGRTGRYKVFPVGGMAVLGVGLYLLSTMEPDTSIWLQSVYMFVLGLGLGLSMQVLTIVVQNTVAYAQLGTATSGVTFFRTIGGAFGTAVFGALYTNSLEPKLGAALAATGVSPDAATSPAAVTDLPASQRIPIIDAYADAVTHVFSWVVPVALAGFVIALFLKEVPLRDSARAAATDLGEGFSAPDSADSVCQLERALAGVFGQVDDREALHDVILADSGTGLTHGQAWALGQVYVRSRVRGEATLETIARGCRVPTEVFEPFFEEVSNDGYLEEDHGRLMLTPAGQGEIDRIHDAWRPWLDTKLDDWALDDPHDRELLNQAIDRITSRLLDEEESRRAAVAA